MPCRGSWGRQAVQSPTGAMASGGCVRLLLSLNPAPERKRRTGALQKAAGMWEEGSSSPPQPWEPSMAGICRVLHPNIHLQAAGWLWHGRAPQQPWVWYFLWVSISMLNLIFPAEAIYPYCVAHTSFDMENKLLWGDIQRARISVGSHCWQAQLLAASSSRVYS